MHRGPIRLNDDDVDDLHRRYCRDKDAVARARLAAVYDPLASSLARRYAGRGEALDDLLQVARLGLLLALERFDPDRGIRFVSFAGTTIRGELRRHFRDRARWRLRVPRSLKERFLLVCRTFDDLTAEAGRLPTTTMIAERCGLSDDEVRQALEVRSAEQPDSLHARIGDGETECLGDVVGVEDPAFDAVDRHDLVASLMRRLDATQRTMLQLRFGDQLTQREIAVRLGVSQMRVSRELSKALDRLRSFAGSQ